MLLKLTNRGKISLSIIMAGNLMGNTSFSKNYDKNLALMDEVLNCNESFDILRKDFLFGDRRARVYAIDGFAKDGTILKMLSPALELQKGALDGFSSIKDFSHKHIGYIEAESAKDLQRAVTMVLSGPCLLFVEGFEECLVIDTREYHVRSVSEPDSDRSLRGAREGFVETLIVNTSMIRRHIRTPDLRVEHFTVGNTSKTDVAMMSIKGRCDEKKVQRLRFRLNNLNVNSLTMKQESLAEALISRGWYNPFPKVRYTERPDCAAASLDEGGIIIIVDGSPAAMLLPTALLDFFQDSNDYYFPPLVGSYLRIMRFVIYTLTFFLIPTWYLLIKNPSYIPSWLEFIKIKEMNKVPIFIQLMLVELVITCLKQASLNTPSSLGSSFSVVAGLLLGDFAVKARWFVPEVLLYMAFVAVANFAQPSYELGYAVKLCRILLITMTALFNIWGFFIGLGIIIFLIATVPTLTGQSYLYPIIPFDGKTLKKALLRFRMDNENS